MLHHGNTTIYVSDFDQTLAFYTETLGFDLRMRVEDHWAEGGLGDAVLAALAEADALDGIRVRKLAVREMPMSGKPDELLHAAGIDAEAIVAAAKELIDSDS